MTPEDRERTLAAIPELANLDEGRPDLVIVGIDNAFPGKIAFGEPTIDPATGRPQVVLRDAVVVEAMVLVPDPDGGGNTATQSIVITGEVLTALVAHCIAVALNPPAPTPEPPVRSGAYL